MEVDVKTISLVLLISMIFYCCTATHMINHDQSAYDELNGLVEGEKAKITLMNDDVFVGEYIYMGTDSTSWVGAEKRKTYRLLNEGPEIVEEWSVPTLDVKKIDVGVPTLDVKKIDVGGNLGQGALGGLFYGFLIGAPLSAIIAIKGMSNDDVPPGYRPYIGGGAVVLGGIAGAIIGLPFGLLAGGTDEYILTKIPGDSVATEIESKELIRNK